jgi:hypothetical protein
MWGSESPMASQLLCRVLGSCGAVCPALGAQLQIGPRFQLEADRASSLVIGVSYGWDRGHEIRRGLICKLVAW